MQSVLQCCTIHCSVISVETVLFLLFSPAISRPLVIFVPSFSCPAFSYLAFSCPAISCLVISCPAIWSVIFTSCIFSQSERGWVKKFGPYLQESIGLPLLSTVGDRAFPVAAARVWNSLPDLVTSAPSVAVFRYNSVPSPLWLYSARAVTLSCFGHYNRSSFLTSFLTYLLTVRVPSDVRDIYHLNRLVQTSHFTEDSSPHTQ